MDIDTRVDGPCWWLVVRNALGDEFVIEEAAYYALQDTPPPRRCDTIIPGSYRGQQCPNCCEPGEYTCRDHPHIGVAP